MSSKPMRLTRETFDNMQGKPFDVKTTPEAPPPVDLDAGLATVVDTEVISPTPIPPTPLPDYVEHAPDATRVGMLTAEVIVKEYESTARQIDAMADELITLQKRMQAEVAVIHQVNDELRLAAQRARDEGKAAFEKIERLSTLTQNIRNQCAELTGQLYKQF